MPDRKFTFFESYAQVAQLMSDEDRLAFYDALVQFGIDGEEPELEGQPLIAFTVARPVIEKSVRRSKVNASNARKRTRANVSKPEANASEPAANVSETERTESEEGDSLQVALFPSEIEEEIEVEVEEEVEKKKRGGVVHHPSWQEWWTRWQEVAGDRGVPTTEVEALKAFNYYDANGWRQKNGNPVKRWKGALMTCFLNAHPNSGKGVGSVHDEFSGYEGRSY